MCLRSFIRGDDGVRREVLTLGPIGVLPEYQRRGIGGALIERTAEIARGMGFRAILLCGDPDYYARRGFVPAESFCIRNAENMYADALQARELYGGAQPEDQPESRALAEYTRRVQPDATVSLHTSGSVIYAEYGDAAANSASMSLAESVSALTGYSISNTESLDAGGYKDWVQSTIGAASITIELGFGDSPQDAGAISSTLARGISIPQAVAEWLSKQ